MRCLITLTAVLQAARIPVKSTSDQIGTWRTWEEILLANRQLSRDERERLFTPLLNEIRERLRILSGGDADLEWALRRKLFKELTYDERGKPMQRRKLKEHKRVEQENECAVCHHTLPSKNAVLDRIEAMKGYTQENTRLLCPECDVQVQNERGYK